MRTRLRPYLLLTAALCGGVIAPSTMSAQGVPARARLSFATRAQIDSMARAAELEAAGVASGSLTHQVRTAEASLLRERLARGDFGVGDRVVVRVEGQTALSDTFTVREGGRLQLPGLPDIDLRQVLRAEAEERVRSQVARYIREPEVRVLPLLRVTILGSVLRPGFYALPADTPLSDVIMAAGGPNAAADLTRVELRRGSDVLYTAKELQTLLRDGLTLDQAHLRAGDELIVGERRRHNWSSVVQLVSMTAGLLSIALALGRN